MASQGTVESVAEVRAALGAALGAAARILDELAAIRRDLDADLDRVAEERDALRGTLAATGQEARRALDEACRIAEASLSVPRPQPVLAEPGAADALESERQRLAEDVEDLERRLALAETRIRDLETQCEVKDRRIRELSP